MRLIFQNLSCVVIHTEKKIKFCLRRKVTNSSGTRMSGHLREIIKTGNKACCQIIIHVNYQVNGGSQVVYLCNYTFDIAQIVPGATDRHTFVWNVYT